MGAVCHYLRGYDRTEPIAEKVGCI
jgi:hypothetical protein